MLQQLLFVSGALPLEARVCVHRDSPIPICEAGDRKHWRRHPKGATQPSLQSLGRPLIFPKLSELFSRSLTVMALDPEPRAGRSLGRSVDDAGSLRFHAGDGLVPNELVEARSSFGALPPRHCLFAEFLGTALLTTFSGLIGLSSPAAVPFLAGAMISCIVLSFIPTSGALLNPFVVLALYVTKRLRLVPSLAYTGAQLAGGTLGAVIFSLLATPDMYNRVAGGTVSLQTNMSLWQGAGWEFFLTFSLISLVSTMGFAAFELHAENEYARWMQQAVFALLIGLLVGFLVGVGGPITGCSMNGARALGPLAVAQLRAWMTAASPEWLERASRGHFVIYWLAPALGSVTGALLMEHAIVSPWLGRAPKSILQDLTVYTKRNMAQLRSYGTAGLLAYGILNTIFYGSVFTYSLVFVFASQPGAIAKAWAASWVASQATKPFRLFLAIAMAPWIRRLLERLPWNRHQN